MINKCQQCRRAEEKLFLKGERCFSPKCAMVRRPTPPGIHGPKTKRKRSLSEFGAELKEKQKLQRSYGLRERQFKNYVKAAFKKEKIQNAFLESLEMRLDNVVFRMGFASSRRQARQMVGHGYFLVNGKKVDRPSDSLKKNDILKINPTKLKKLILEEIKKRIKNFHHPKWLELNKNDLSGKVIDTPRIEEAAQNINIQKIIEFYSR